MLLNSLQGVESLAPAVAVEADVANRDLLPEVLNEPLHIHKELNIRDEEAVRHCHVVHVPGRFGTDESGVPSSKRRGKLLLLIKVVAEVPAEDALLRGQLPGIGNLLFNELLLSQLQFESGKRGLTEVQRVRK